MEAVTWPFARPRDCNLFILTDGARRHTNSTAELSAVAEALELLGVVFSRTTTMCVHLFRD